MFVLSRARVLVWILAVGCLPGLGWSADLGDAAAPLNIQKWVKGSAVDLANRDKVYVVEFWATWCGPCRTSIPHLTELQEKYKDDVVFIGVSDEPAETVNPFLETMGDTMDYRVAIDPTRETHAGYMAAYGRNGIPSAFIVDREGRVAWVGHPMSNLDETLSRVIDGTYDLELARRAQQAERSMPEYLRLIASGKNDEAQKLGTRIALDGKGNPQMLNNFAWTILTKPGLAHRDLELAKNVARLAYDVTNGKDASITDTYARAFHDLGDLENALKYQQEAVDLATRPALVESLTNTLTEYQNEAQEPAS